MAQFRTMYIISLNYKNYNQLVNMCITLYIAVVKGRDYYIYCLIACITIHQNIFVDSILKF